MGRKLFGERRRVKGKNYIVGFLLTLFGVTLREKKRGGACRHGEDVDTSRLSSLLNNLLT